VHRQFYHLPTSNCIFLARWHGRLERNNHAWLSPSPQSWHADMGTAKHMPNHQFRCWGHETYQHLSPQIVEHLWIIDNFSKNIHCQFGQSPGALAALSTVSAPLAQHQHMAQKLSFNAWLPSTLEAAQLQPTWKMLVKYTLPSSNISFHMPPINISHSWAHPQEDTIRRQLRMSTQVAPSKKKKQLRAGGRSLHWIQHILWAILFARHYIV
jgi:hypothetical protein